MLLDVKLRVWDPWAEAQTESSLVFCVKTAALSATGVQGANGLKNAGCQVNWVSQHALMVGLHLDDLHRKPDSSDSIGCSLTYSIIYQ